MWWPAVQRHTMPSSMTDSHLFDCEPLPYLYLTSAVQIILELKSKILYQIPNENVHFRSKLKCNICNAHARTMFSSIGLMNFPVSTFTPKKNIPYIPSELFINGESPATVTYCS